VRIAIPTTAIAVKGFPSCPVATLFEFISALALTGPSSANVRSFFSLTRHFYELPLRVRGGAFFAPKSDPPAERGFDINTAMQARTAKKSISIRLGAAARPQ
jgi:hypothetical protein